jgi:hypothetical protein
MRRLTPVLMWMLSCSSPPVGAPPPSPAESRPPAPGARPEPGGRLDRSTVRPGERPQPPPRYYRGLLHVHSAGAAGSRITYDQILAAAKRAKVDFVCIEDPPPKGDPGQTLREGWTGLHDGVLFIPGAEYENQILAMGIREPVPPKDRRSMIRAIHAQGGLAFAWNPKEIMDWSEFEEADGMELYNLRSELAAALEDSRFQELAASFLKNEPRSVWPLLRHVDASVLARWDEINKTRPFAGIAGSEVRLDATLRGLELDHSLDPLEFVSTCIQADELTARGVLDALREGRGFIAFDRFVERHFYFRHVKAEDGRQFVEGYHSMVNAENATELYRDGQFVASWTAPGDYRREITEPGSYRVLYRILGRPDALSNPVRVR